MGRVAGSYGVRGWVKVAPGGGAQAGLAGAAEGGSATSVQGDRGESARRPVVAKLEGSSRSSRRGAQGSGGRLERSRLPDPGKGITTSRTWWARGGERAGRVPRRGAEAVTNGAQDVMEVAGDRTRLLPGWRSWSRQWIFCRRDFRAVGSGLVIRFDVVTLFPRRSRRCRGAGSPAARSLRGCGRSARGTRGISPRYYRTVDDRPYGGGPGMVSWPSRSKQR